MKIDRLLAQVILLLENDLVPASALAERFSVSVRTIQRDMDTLMLAGIPVYAQQGSSGGYGILPEYKLNNRLISGEDLLNLITALKGIQGTFADKRFLGSLEQICSLVPSRLASRVAEREDTLLFNFSLSVEDSVLADKLRLLEQAVRGRQVVRCLYTGHRQETLSRTIEPMTLILQWGAWYLYGFCRNRCDYRLFRISRMHELSAEGEIFERRAKSYREFVSERPDFDVDSVIDLVFLAQPSARAVVEENHPARELTYREDGSILVRCRQPEEDRLYRYLLSYGDAVTVLEPLHVGDKVKEIAKKILAL